MEERSSRRAASIMMCNLGAVVPVAEKLVFLYGTCGYEIMDAWSIDKCKSKNYLDFWSEDMLSLTSKEICSSPTLDYE
jgi:hypothetical protein